MNTISAAAMSVMAKKMDKHIDDVKVAEEATNQKPIVPEIPMAIPTQYATIAIYGHGGLDKRTLEIISACFSEEVFPTDRDHGVRVIRFFADGRPVKNDGTKLLGTCHTDLGGISVNLVKHFEKAVEMCMSSPAESVYSRFYMLLLTTIMHEACHISNRQTEAGRTKMDALPDGEEETTTEAWANTKLIDIAKTINIEPCVWSEMPFFKKSWNELMSKSPEDEWAVRQQYMLDNRMFVKVEPVEGEHTGFIGKNLRDNIQLTSPDYDNDEIWERPTTNIQAFQGMQQQEVREYRVQAVATEAVEQFAGGFAAGAVSASQTYTNSDPLFGMSGTEMVDTGEADLYGGFADDEYGTQFGEADFTPNFGKQQPPVGSADDMGMFMAMGHEGAFNTTHQAPDAFNRTAPTNMQNGFSQNQQSQNQQQNNFSGGFGQQAQGGFSQNQQGGNQDFYQATPRHEVYQNHNIPMQELGEIVRGVYFKLYNHLFSVCQPVANDDRAFLNPAGITTPIVLNEKEKMVVVKMDCVGQNGQLERGVPAANGIRGFVSSQAKLPMYRLYLNVNGQEDVRTVMPQNPNKRNPQGAYSKPALDARGGTAIMYVIEGDDSRVQGGGSKWLFKIINGQFMNC